MNKKLMVLLGTLIIAFILFLIIYLTPKEYEKEYSVDSFSILERYDKDKKSYSFNIKFDNIEFLFTSNQKYTTNRKLIVEIDEYNSASGICIIPIIREVKTFPLCYENETLIDYHLVSDELKKELPNEVLENLSIIDDKYNNIEINYLDNNTYLLWNYKGFSLIDKTRKENLNIFNTDVYNLDLAVIINDYLLLADYNQKYNFDKMFVINLKNMNIEEWVLDNEISFDSYILGTDDKSVYLVDKKNSIEYELVPHKKKMRKVGTSSKKGKIIVDNVWTSINVSKLVSKKYEFTYLHNHEYSIDNNILYLNYEGSSLKTKVSDKEITEIISIDYDKVYYLVEDKLYMYSIETGEIELFEYFEWNFNNKNMIFIYNS